VAYFESNVWAIGRLLQGDLTTFRGENGIRQKWHWTKW